MDGERAIGISCAVRRRERSRIDVGNEATRTRRRPAQGAGLVYCARFATHGSDLPGGTIMPTTTRCAAALATLIIAVLFAAPGAAQQGASKTPEQEDAERIADLVTANHILADQGVVDGFGHISVRSAKNPNHYFISRSRAPALVTVDDIMEIDLDDNPIDARGRTSYLERFIHSEIYKVRPDVLSVVHTHSPGVIPFGVSDVPLRPVSHIGGFLIRAVPVFEIRDAGGNETDMLIRNKALGAALAKQLGSGVVVLMRGHGDTVVGNSVKTAVFHAIYTDVNARLEAEAIRLGGKVTYLNEVEAKKIGDQNDNLVDRPWEIWKIQAQAHAQSK
jgi:HCOMODA/2-hydroxy-3-carboxy-muconic semialdehyde decarboxylase